MKIKLPILLLLLQSATTALFAQSANTALSNLSATAVNADLVPSSDKTRLLGSPAKAWKQLYLGDY